MVREAGAGEREGTGEFEVAAMKEAGRGGGRLAVVLAVTGEGDVGEIDGG